MGTAAAKKDKGAPGPLVSLLLGFPLPRTRGLSRRLFYQEDRGNVTAPFPLLR